MWPTGLTTANHWLSPFIVPLGMRGEAQTTADWTGHYHLRSGSFCPDAVGEPTIPRIFCQPKSLIADFMTCCHTLTEEFVLLVLSASRPLFAAFSSLALELDASLRIGKAIECLLEPTYALAKRLDAFLNLFTHWQID